MLSWSNPNMVKKKIAGDVSYFFVYNFNRSFSEGQVPHDLKSAVVTQLLKKDGLNPNEQLSTDF